MIARLRVSVPVFALFLVGTVLPSPAISPLRPFGSRPVGYAAGTIRPNHLSQAVLDQQVRAVYDAWKARYLRSGCGAGQYYVAAQIDDGNLTVSEAHGYGMLLTVLMAGHDPQAQAIFDGLYAFFRAHPTATHANLMSWYQGSDCRDAEGQDSATDGDLDIALALLLADKQWGGCEAIDYRAAALEVIADIGAGERDPSGRILWLGDWVGGSSARYKAATRSSDFMPAHLRSFAQASGDAAWTRLLDATYELIDTMQTTWAPSTGLLPDFVESALTAPKPAAANFLEGANDGAYDYNACRVPWRVGTDAALSGDARARAATQRLTSWIRTASGGDPSRIASGYTLNGTVSSGANYPSMAFIAPFGVAAMGDAGNQAWLNAIWDKVVATPVSAEGYYENSIKLLSMLVMSGNWWAPEAVRGTLCSAAPTSTPNRLRTPTPTPTRKPATPTATRRLTATPTMRAATRTPTIRATATRTPTRRPTATPRRGISWLSWR